MTYVLRILSAICEVYAGEQEKFTDEATLLKMRTIEIWAHMWNIHGAMETANERLEFQVNVLPALIHLFRQSVDLHARR